MRARSQGALAFSFTMLLGLTYLLGRPTTAHAWPYLGWRVRDPCNIAVFKAPGRWGLRDDFICPLVDMAADYDSLPGLTVRYNPTRTQEQTRVYYRAMRPREIGLTGAGGYVLPQSQNGFCADSATFMATGKCEMYDPQKRPHTASVYIRTDLLLPYEKERHLVTHEMGHMLGLAHPHPPVLPCITVMCPFALEGCSPLPYALQPIDKQNLNAIY